MLWKKRSRLRNLRAQQMVLCVLLLFELAAAAMALAFELASWISHQPGLYTQPPYGQESRFDHLVSISNSEFYFFPTFELYPLICLFLQISLLVFARRNRQNPVIGKEGIWTILLAVQLPAYCWWLTQSVVVHEIAAVLVIASIFPLNFVLIRNLWQYTQAIRREKRGESGGAGELGQIADTAFTVPIRIPSQELLAQRHLLRILKTLELFASAAFIAGKLVNKFVPTAFWQNSLRTVFPYFDRQKFSQLFDRFESFLTIVFFPVCCMVLLTVLLLFLQRNKPNYTIGRDSVWIILLAVELPAAAWWIDFMGENSHMSPSPAILLLAVFLLNYFLLRNLRQYTRAIEYEKQHEMEKNASLADM